MNIKPVSAIDVSHPAQPTAEEIGAGYRQFVGDEVDLWHFPMMNDVVRNAAYEKALKGALHSAAEAGRKKTVLEIGTGSGLLSMMAARHGAAKVTTCEAIPMIARKAEEIIRKNGFADRVKVINRLSTNLAVGEQVSIGSATGLAERADVLVTEIFDDGLLGEGAFVAIKHAITHLLKPNAQIIPAGVRVTAVCIESAEIFENHRVAQVSGFDLSAFNEFTVQKYMGYHLNKMKYRALSAPKQVWDFDFHHLPGTETKPIEFEVTEDGLCHAVAFWYELQLDETTTVSTAPGQAALSCWKQAILLNETPRPLKKGERLALTAHHDTESLWFTASSP
ncbi:MAG: 50S ribosomal protein L11 methyltransferase [Methylotenera sp.]|nr:50S ribosomal protein L11 methyltransferase [Oligoflexia bacterium]